MWVRKCDVDALEEAPSPIPTQLVSNEEFIPVPQTAQQKAFAERLTEISERNARRLGVSRRRFLRTGAGMASALLALNDIFGDCYDVSAAEAADPKAFEEKWPKEQFIFDIQTHHVDISRKWYEETEDGKATANFIRMLRGKKKIEDAVEAFESRPLRQGSLRRQRYGNGGDQRRAVPELGSKPTASRSDGRHSPIRQRPRRNAASALPWLLRPNLGPKEFDEMERQVKELKIDAWKMYTGAEIGEKAWRMDDEKVAYPFWESTKKLGIKNLCVHKGLPLGVFNEKACTPLDLEKAAKDWPDLNFIVYHSGFRGFGGWPRDGRKSRRQERSRCAGDPLDQRHPPDPEEKPGHQEHLF